MVVLEQLADELVVVLCQMLLVYDRVEGQTNNMAKLTARTVGYMYRKRAQTKCSNEKLRSRPELHRQLIRRSKTIQGFTAIRLDKRRRPFAEPS